MEDCRCLAENDRLGYLAGVSTANGECSTIPLTWVKSLKVAEWLEELLEGESLPRRLFLLTAIMCVSDLILQERALQQRIHVHFLECKFRIPTSLAIKMSLPSFRFRFGDC